MPGNTRQAMLTHRYRQAGGPHGHHERGRSRCRRKEQGRSQEPRPEPGDRPEPPRTGQREQDRDGGQDDRPPPRASGLESSASQMAARTVNGSPLAAIPRSGGRGAVEGQRCSADPSHDAATRTAAAAWTARRTRGTGRPRRRAGRRPRPAIGASKAPSEKSRPCFRFAPHRHQEPSRGQHVDDRRAEREVSERQDRHGQREGEPEDGHSRSRRRRRELRGRTASRSGRTGAPRQSTRPPLPRVGRGRAAATRPERPGSDPRPCGRAACGRRAAASRQGLLHSVAGPDQGRGRR